MEYLHGALLEHFLPETQQLSCSAKALVQRLVKRHLDSNRTLESQTDAFQSLSVDVSLGICLTLSHNFEARREIPLLNRYPGDWLLYATVQRSLKLLRKRNQRARSLLRCLDAERMPTSLDEIWMRVRYESAPPRLSLMYYQTKPTFVTGSEEHIVHSGQ